MMFESPLYNLLIPHTIRFKVVHRQDASEEKYLRALRKIRNGKCGADTTRTLKAFNRKTDDPNDEAVHLYYTNLNVETHNASRLAQMPEDHAEFIANEFGDIRGMNCPAQKRAFAYIT